MTEGGTPPFALARVPLLCTAILIGLAVAGTVAWHYGAGAQAVAFGLEAARPWLAVWRAALFAALIVLWPRLINWLAARYGWSDGQWRHVSAQRWRVATWLIVIELVLVQNLVGRFINGVL